MDTSFKKGLIMITEDTISLMILSGILTVGGMFVIILGVNPSTFAGSQFSSLFQTIFAFTGALMLLAPVILPFVWRRGHS